MPNSVSAEIIYIKHRAAIAGHVTDAITSGGILGATVEVVGKNLHTKTREDGFFYFVDLEKGQYDLSVLVPQGSRSCYGGSDNEPTKTITGTIVESDGKPIFDLKANVRLSPTSVVGYVKRSDNALPIPNAIVKLLVSEIQIFTDKDGKYILSGVPTGNYTIQVSANDIGTNKEFATQTQLVTFTAGKETSAQDILLQLSASST